MVNMNNDASEYLHRLVGYYVSFEVAVGVVFFFLIGGNFVWFNANQKPECSLLCQLSTFIFFLPTARTIIMAILLHSMPTFVEHSCDSKC